MTDYESNDDDYFDQDGPIYSILEDKGCCCPDETGQQCGRDCCCCGLYYAPIGPNCACAPA